MVLVRAINHPAASNEVVVLFNEGPGTSTAILLAWCTLSLKTDGRVHDLYRHVLRKWAIPMARWQRLIQSGILGHEQI